MKFSTTSMLGACVAASLCTSSSALADDLVALRSAHGKPHERDQIEAFKKH